MPSGIQRFSKRGLFVAAVLLAIGAGVLALRFGRQAPGVELRDGSILRVSRAKVGRTNVFEHGTALEKLLGNLIASNGWKWGSLELNRPHAIRAGRGSFDSVLTLELRLEPKSPGSVKALFPRRFFLARPDFRLLHWGDDGYRFTKSYLPVFPMQSGGVFYDYAIISAFARTSRKLHFELQRRDSLDGPWQPMARFEIENPARAEEANWVPEPFPVVRSNEWLKVTMGAAQVERPRDKAEEPFAVHQTRVLLPFRFEAGGKTAVNWAVWEVKAADSMGNTAFLPRSSVMAQWTNGWLLYSSWRSVHPAAVWRVRAHFSRVSDFPEDQVFSVRLPWEPRSRTVLKTNFAGLPVRIVAGDPSSVEARIPSSAEDRRLIFIGAEDEDGAALETWGARDEQHSFNRILSGGMNSVLVHFAITEDVAFEFTIKPKMVEEITAPQP